jgi:hypothetical protein
VSGKFVVLSIALKEGKIKAVKDEYIFAYFKILSECSGI